MKGFMHTTNDETALVDVVITSRDRISKLDSYVGYMELTDGSDVLIYNVDGILMGYVSVESMVF